MNGRGKRVGDCLDRQSIFRLVADPGGTHRRPDAVAPQAPALVREPTPH